MLCTFSLCSRSFSSFVVSTVTFFPVVLKWVALHASEYKELEQFNITSIHDHWISWLKLKWMYRRRYLQVEYRSMFYQFKKFSFFYFSWHIEELYVRMEQHAEIIYFSQTIVDSMDTTQIIYILSGILNHSPCFVRHVE